jgi:hypothetical protein
MPRTAVRSSATRPDHPVQASSGTRPGLIHAQQHPHDAAAMGMLTEGDRLALGRDGQRLAGTEDRAAEAVQLADAVDDGRRVAVRGDPLG